MRRPGWCCGREKLQKKVGRMTLMPTILTIRRSLRIKKRGIQIDTRAVVFMHGLGVGIGPYSSWIIEKLPNDRTILCPEWPNISYGIERGHEYPTPRELAQFLRTSVENAIKKVKNKTTLTANEIECDCIGHSYGTVVLTGFRKYYRDVVRRSVFIDPVCFVPSFGRYLKYAFEEHLHAWFQFSSYIRTKIKNPDEPMDFMNVFMSTWFVKGDPSTQHLMKRLLFPQESWERGPLDERDCLVLSGKDANRVRVRIFKRRSRRSGRKRRFCIKDSGNTADFC